jgi:hypothetical protein
LRDSWNWILSRASKNGEIVWEPGNVTKVASMAELLGYPANGIDFVYLAIVAIVSILTQ